jgi:hypothetical protein
MGRGNAMISQYVHNTQTYDEQGLCTMHASIPTPESVL